MLRAVGCEGPWNPKLHEDHYLLAGKNSVLTYTICSYIMGNDPEQPKLLRPDGTLCDNHLYLASQKGMGTNLMGEIELVGDGAGSILGIDEGQINPGDSPLILYPNYPNPFSTSTQIRYYLHDQGHASLIIFNHKGQEIKRLVNEAVSSGEHIVEWNPGNISAGTYYARLNVNGYSQVKKMNLKR